MAALEQAVTVTVRMDGLYRDSRQALEWIGPLLRAEIIVALREPHRKLVTLLRNRSADFAQIDAIASEIAADNWGLF